MNKWRITWLQKGRDVQREWMDRRMYGWRDTVLMESDVIIKRCIDGETWRDGRKHTHTHTPGGRDVQIKESTEE